MKKGYKYNRVLVRRPAMDRFLEKFIPEPNSGCWLWLGALCNKRYGYGSFFLRGHQTAHRAAWMIFCGPIPEGLEVDHRCRNPHCVNPDHLRIVTKAINLAHRTKERSVCWQGHRLTGGNVRMIGGKVRVCRICRAATELRYREKKKREAAETREKRAQEAA